MQDKTILALTFIRSVVLSLPGVTEQLCFETPAFYVNKHIFARLKEDEENLVIHTIEREKWMLKDHRPSLSPTITLITNICWSI